MKIDFFSVFSNMMLPILIFSPLLIVLFFFKSRWFKGKAGEFIVDLSGKLTLNKNIYHCFKDLIIEIDNNITQIDEIIVSKYGVFVIEVKNINGWIFGKEKDKYWTQKLYKNTFKFQNPLLQNYKHIKFLQKYLGLKNNQLFSVISFVGESKFKTKMPENVTKGIGFIKYIKSQKKVVINDNTLENIIDRLEYSKLKSNKKAKRKHITYLKRNNK